MQNLSLVQYTWGSLPGFLLKFFNDDFFLKPVLEFSFFPNFVTIYDLNVSNSYPTRTTSMAKMSPSF